MNEARSGIFPVSEDLHHWNRMVLGLSCVSGIRAVKRTQML
jgi:hypothetical protein